MAWLTAQDESDYGRDLVDFAQRAAVHALSPKLQALESAECTNCSIDWRRRRGRGLTWPWSAPFQIIGS